MVCEQISVGSPLIPVVFARTDVAASLTNQALDRDGLAGVVDYFPGFDGSIVGMQVDFNTNITAGLNTFKPAVDGTAVTATELNLTVPVGSRSLASFTRKFRSGFHYTKTQRVSVQLTTDASHAPITDDCKVTLFLMPDRLEF